ncbi:MAG: phage holin family protein, partial [Bacillota bacterium]
MNELFYVPLIVIVVYMIMEIYKITIAKEKKVLKQLIPVLSCFTGMVLGGISFYFLPEVIQTESLTTALTVGGASGLAATGANQIVKQFNKND